MCIRDRGTDKEQKEVEDIGEKLVKCRAQLTTSFCVLLKKLWCGQFSSVHPKAFKMALSLVHPSFSGLRQVGH